MMHDFIKLVNLCFYYSDFFVNNFIYSLKIDIHIYLYKVLVLVLGNRTRNRYFEEYSYSESVLGQNFGIVPSLLISEYQNILLILYDMFLFK